MHVLFIPYGSRLEVELLLRDMESQKHEFIMTNGDEKVSLVIAGSIRMLPLGIYEYVFPKESKDCVLHTLIRDKNRYAISELLLSFLRKMFRAEKVGDYKKTQFYRWNLNNINILVLGIREDLEMTEPEKSYYPNFKHEAL